MLNKVTLIGRLGRDPELKKAQTGKSITTFSLATSESWYDKATNTRQDRTEWHRCVVFADKLADSVAKNAGKGDMLYVEGKLVTREWEKDGQKRYTTEVVIDFNGTVRFLTPKKESSKSAETSEYDDSDFGGSSSDPSDEMPF